MISLYVFDHNKADICDCVSILCTILPLWMFHILICLSEVPPPVASILCCHGHQATAFTAALCWRNTCTGSWFDMGDEDNESFVEDVSLAMSQILTRLSLAPLAKYLASQLHFKPQISCVCNLSEPVWCWAIRTSWLWISPDLEPELSKWEFHANEPIRVWCDFIWRRHTFLLTSHNSTTFFELPTASMLPFCIQDTELM